mmetsp:Transcript_16476/g.21382  ORF Transcript_16476/g.21382 Transcript_16476/m.21382 type:complete len:85 (+) Transcript_16476:116-370(+)
MKELAEFAWRKEDRILLLHADAQEHKGGFTDIVLTDGGALSKTEHFPNAQSATSSIALLQLEMMMKTKNGNKFGFSFLLCVIHA